MVKALFSKEEKNVIKWFEPWQMNSNATLKIL
jgi:hypothetical protein